jgi:hypothetical protein
MYAMNAKKIPDRQLNPINVPIGLGGYIDTGVNMIFLPPPPAPPGVIPPAPGVNMWGAGISIGSFFQFDLARFQFI